MEFDTGAFYLLFMSLMITVKIIEWLSLRRPIGFTANNATAILLSDFIAVAIFSPILSFGMVWHLESSGYVKCVDPASISRISRGESYIFKRGACSLSKSNN